MKRSIIVFLLTYIVSISQAQTLPKNVRMISTGKVIHRFFDTSSISPSGKYIALFRFPYEDHSPVAGDAGEVILIDLKTGKEKVVAKSRGWEMQLAANVQWGATDNELYFNDVDPVTWQAYAVCLNPFTKVAKRMSSTVFMVTADGKKLATYNLIKSTFAQVGYGVIIPREKISRNYGPVSDDGIIVTDVKSNSSKQIVSINQIYEQTRPSIKIKNPQDFEFYCFQVKWNLQGTKLLTTIQWSPKGGGERKRAVITMNADGSDLYTAITPEQWEKGGHHVNWMPDGTHLSMNLNIDGKPGLEIITVKYDGSELKSVYSPGSGHPSYNPKGLSFVITDAYAGEMPLKEGTSPIRLINVKKQTEKLVAGAQLPPIKDFEFRVDAHPTWDRTGRYVIYNGTHLGTRSVFIADLKDMLPVKK
ncbi:hypothetical protein EZ428_19170 [Pedobacter frigiditerrae]|uniref:WD40-like Beta Propeller Repeat n=1 Tax=Pedobacter frigiditerrae TaxID=2530452 RepID=A0A4R0MRV4_9SPHI|nr:hypothetical protein [Pedobacter frigiditerrae]TCC88754.1 hypothetical protein EZ428_19170 [Pedobacter frigiditerrae]